MAQGPLPGWTGHQGLEAEGLGPDREDAIMTKNEFFRATRYDGESESFSKFIAWGEEYYPGFRDAWNAMSDDEKEIAWYGVKREWYGVRRSEFWREVYKEPCE